MRGRATHNLALLPEVENSRDEGSSQSLVTTHQSLIPKKFKEALPAKTGDASRGVS
jgi:hypothetical protein